MSVGVICQCYLLLCVCLPAYLYVTPCLLTYYFLSLMKWAPSCNFWMHKLSASEAHSHIGDMCGEHIISDLTVWRSVWTFNGRISMTVVVNDDFLKRFIICLIAQISANLTFTSFCRWKLSLLAAISMMTMMHEKLFYHQKVISLQNTNQRVQW